ncbi:MAG TPA: twin-arginine translocase subunit TatC [Actinomycetota bacterium]|nr:twin-arginine translocase subunit TatC [Actinomycetota bacterium]
MGDQTTSWWRRFSLRRRRKAPQPASMTMMEHLGELRSRLIVVLGTFIAVSTVAFIFFEPISDFLLQPLCDLPPERLGPQGCQLIFNSALEPIQVRLKVTALVGLIFSSPMWLYQLWAFVTPGLTAKEKRYALPFVSSSVVLFAIGATLAYVTLPAALRFLISLGGDNLVPFFTADRYLNFIGLVILAFGASFELPLLLFFLGLAGFVTVEQLRHFRRGAIVGITLLAAVITPSQDPYTMLGMAIPLYGLYEAVIVALSFRDKRSRKASKSP